MQLKECGVEECEPLLTFLAYLIEFPQPPIMLIFQKHEKDLEKESMEKVADLESNNSRGHKRVRR